MANISSMKDIQNPFKETIAKFMEAELYSEYDYKKKVTDSSRNSYSRKILLVAKERQ